MGSFNVHCAITNLPIVMDDDVVQFVLNTKTYNMGAGSFSDTIIASFPIYSKYYDYGQTKEYMGLHMEQCMTMHRHAFDYVVKRRNQNREYWENVKKKHHGDTYVSHQDKLKKLADAIIKHRAAPELIDGELNIDYVSSDFSMRTRYGDVFRTSAFAENIWTSRFKKAVDPLAMITLYDNTSYAIETMAVDMNYKIHFSESAGQEYDDELEIELCEANIKMLKDRTKHWDEF